MMRLSLWMMVVLSVILTAPPGALSLDAPAKEAPLSVSAEGLEKVDLNRATVQDLESVTGIGPVLARRIIDYRKNSGSFASVDDLLEVQGIGEVKLETLRGQVAVTPSP